MRTSRSRVARFAVKTLVTLLKETPLIAANGSMPAHRELKIAGLFMILTEGFMVFPAQARRATLLDVWKGRKVLFVEFESLNIVGYKLGDWMDIVTDLAYEQALRARAQR